MGHICCIENQPKAMAYMKEKVSGVGRGICQQTTLKYPGVHSGTAVV